MTFVEDIRLFSRLLGDAKIPYMFVGAVALEGLGVPRATFDVDIQVAATPPAPSASSYLGWIVEERASDNVFGQPVVILHRPTSPIPFELFFTEHWFTRQALERRQVLPSRLLRMDVPIPRPEDFVLLKASFMLSPNRSPRKRTQDALDIDGVLAAHPGRMNRDYLQANARKLGIAKDVDGLLRHRGPGA